MQHPTEKRGAGREEVQRIFGAMARFCNDDVRRLLEPSTFVDSLRAYRKSTLFVTLILTRSCAAPS